MLQALALEQLLLAGDARLILRVRNARTSVGAGSERDQTSFNLVPKRDQHHQAHFIDKRLIRKKPLVLRKIRVFVSEPFGSAFSFGSDDRDDLLWRPRDPDVKYRRRERADPGNRFQVPL
jgi:hypothetical protein